MSAQLSGFTTVKERGFYRPSGFVSAGQLGDMINLALKLACEDELDEIVVNITDMTGFASPGPAYRRWVAGRWADTVEGNWRWQW